VGGALDHVSPRETVAVAIFSKAPTPGAVNTRLCPPLTPRQAATLGRCFLRDKIAQVRGLTGTTPVIAYAPASERDVFERLAPDFALRPQHGRDLGERMRSALGALLHSGHRAAIAIGTDTPTLPTAQVQHAVDLTASGDVDVVLGPSEDGGYYLIGVRGDYPTLFENIPWSTAAVLDVTRRRAEGAGLRTALLPRWFDVDTADDLVRLRAALVETPHVAPATSRFFRGHDACRLRAQRTHR
jgi:rSAM/selenodomain-associated transferase 1